jgi:hypothetical protein
MAAMTEKVLSMPEALEKLDRVRVFNVVRILKEGGAKDVCASPDGFIVFYADAADAEAALAEMTKLHSEGMLRLETIPLGRAFALTQGLMGLKAPMPTRIQFSQAIVAQEGDRGVPEELKARMAKTGPFPLFFLPGLGAPAIMPIFFSRADLTACWAKKHTEAMPEASVTDLRVLVARTMQEPGDWKQLVFVHGHAEAQLIKRLDAQAKREQS